MLQSGRKVAFCIATFNGLFPSWAVTREFGVLAAVAVFYRPAPSFPFSPIQGEVGNEGFVLPCASSDGENEVVAMCIFEVYKLIPKSLL